MRLRWRTCDGKYCDDMTVARARPHDRRHQSRSAENALVEIAVGQALHTVSGVVTEDVDRGVLAGVPFEELCHSYSPRFDEGLRGDVVTWEERHCG